MKLFIWCIFIGLCISCGNINAKIDGKWLPHTGIKTVVVLQPLSYSGKFLSELKDSIPQYYPVTVTILTDVNMPPNAWYAPRSRYKADSILAFLVALKPGGARMIAGVTDKDISTKKGDNPDYGVMGLGLQPGYASVVSTFSLRKNNPSDELLFHRLLKTILHEMGHNFGLPHCSDRHCIMADAEGGLKQDNETGLCELCRKKLGLQ